MNGVSINLFVLFIWGQEVGKQRGEQIKLFLFFLQFLLVFVFKALILQPTYKV